MPVCVTSLETPPIPTSLTERLSSNQVAAAEGPASVGDGVEGDKDLPAALHREAVELYLPLRVPGGGSAPSNPPRTHR